MVNDPYIELHTGPGRGYPIFHVTERGERIIILTVATLLSTVWADALRWSMLLLALLTNLTVLQRTFHFKKASKKKKENVGII